MLFSSIPFLYCFLPAVVLVYFLVPRALKNTVLLLFSLLFYAWGEPKYVFLMLATIALFYGCGLAIGKARQQCWKKFWLLLSVAVGIGLLGVFKYADFFVENFNAVTGLNVGLLRLALPVGISFYTFQSLSYVIDVYRGNVPMQKNPISFGAYVALFPQLIAGPIVRYKDIDDQLQCREQSVLLVSSGIRTFTAGLAKKVLLGNTAGELWNYFSSLPKGELTVVGSWFGIICFSFQLYFDFSGYSDMAIGLGKMFGFRFLENFNYPYISKSITEFWRRWHISLSSWFREYVYIPLGGNRRGTARMYLNLFIVWMLTGLWHGANWNFVLWGLYYAVLLIIEKAFLGKLIEKLPALFAHIYSLFFIIIGWLIFVFDSSSINLTLANGLQYLKTMFGGGTAGLINQADVWDILRSAVLMIILVMASLPVGRRLFWRVYEKKSWFPYVSGGLCVVTIIICIAYLVDSSFNPFLYFRF